MHPISSAVHLDYHTHEDVTEPELFVLRFGPGARLDIDGADLAHTLMFIADISLPASCLIAMIERDKEIIVAVPDTELLATDEVAIIGEPSDLQNLRTRPRGISKMSRIDAAATAGHYGSKRRGCRL